MAANAGRLTELPKDKERCYKSRNSHSAFIEFHLDEHRCKAFSTSHLITYSLDPNPGAEDDKAEPSQKLHLVFSTADVVILGWRLTLLAERICESRLYAVSILAKRYAELDAGPCVSSISIQPIEEKMKS
jgi:hypothetical protein